MRFQRTLITLGVSILSVAVSSAQHSQMPPGMTHAEHLKQMHKGAELKKRGTQAMGFDQDTTTHHFRLTPSGGVIEVGVNDPADTTSREQIREHLKEISREFSNGLFDKPLATHAEVPPGVADMERLKGSISYEFEDTAAGGLVRISTINPDALRAVHDFLRYQIKEHATGDVAR
jgi:hypothetical protein